jgi:hypothetical protein
MRLPGFRDMIIPPGNPRDHFRGMEGLMPMARGGLRTEGSTVNTLGKLMGRGGAGRKRKGGKRK